MRGSEGEPRIDSESSVQAPFFCCRRHIRVIVLTAMDAKARTVFAAAAFASLQEEGTVVENPTDRLLCLELAGVGRAASPVDEQEARRKEQKESDRRR